MPGHGALKRDLAALAGDYEGAVLRGVVRSARQNGPQAGTLTIGDEERGLRPNRLWRRDPRRPDASPYPLPPLPAHDEHPLEPYARHGVGAETAIKYYAGRLRCSRCKHYPPRENISAWGQSLTAAYRAGSKRA